MRNKTDYMRIRLVTKCRTPRKNGWCVCKFKTLRYMIISKACNLIEMLECKCERPEWTEEEKMNWLRQHGFIQDQLTEEEMENEAQSELNAILEEQLRDLI